MDKFRKNLYEIVLQICLISTWIATKPFDFLLLTVSRQTLMTGRYPQFFVLILLFLNKSHLLVNIGVLAILNMGLDLKRLISGRPVI